MRRSSRIRTQANSIQKNKPFQSSIVAVIIDRCQKLTQEIQKNNIKSAALIMSNLNKDIVLLHHTHPSYNRLHSLTYNTKAAYYRKIGDCEEALKLIDEAISIEKSGNVDAIDMARTLLNKSVLMGQMARSDMRSSKNDGLNVGRSFNISTMTFPRQSSLATIDQNLNESPEKSQMNQNKKIDNLYSHQAAIGLAKQALQLIKNRPQGRQLVQKDQYKLGQLIIISFHNIATEMIFLNNQKQAYNLFKKAHQIALRLMGPRHNLTQHLKMVLNKTKQESRNSKSKNEEAHITQTKKGKHFRRVVTESNSITNDIKFEQLEQQEQRSMPKKIPTIKQHDHRESRRKWVQMNKTTKDKKIKSFIKAYGGDTKVNDKNQKDQPIEMKQLDKLQKIYRPSQTQNKYLPSIKRKNIKEIITEGSVRKPLYFQNPDRRKNIISSTQAIEPVNMKSSKKMPNAKSTQKIVAQERGEKQQNQKVKQQQKTPDLDPHLRHTQAIQNDKGCQLI